MDDPYPITNGGNINTIPGLATIPGPSALCDCSPKPANGTFCYYPTNGRLGMDNSNLLLTSAVLNVNTTLDPSVPAGVEGNTQFAGTRTRVLNKTAVYNAQPVAPRDPLAVTPAERAVGNMSDLYSNDGAGTPIYGTPYTAVLSADEPTAPLFYEPQWLRGRPEGSSSNSPAYLVGTVASDKPQNNLYIQQINYIAVPGDQTSGNVPYYPVLGNGSLTGSDGNAVAGFPFAVMVPAYQNPGLVAQQSSCSNAAPLLHTGDARVQKVIFRKGRLYDAPTSGQADSKFAETANAPGTISSQVSYDIIPVAPDSGAAFSTNWYRTSAYAPMFDVPLNARMLAGLEKLFVGTTFPPLSNVPGPSQRAPAPDGDPRYQTAATGRDHGPEPA